MFPQRNHFGTSDDGAGSCLHQMFANDLDKCFGSAFYQPNTGLSGTFNSYAAFLSFSPMQLGKSDSHPLISIITPSFNRGNMIDEAIQSVRAQNYQNIEHIIVDGGSTDSTLEFLTQYPDIHVVSEPDNGLYDAINKGIALAQGEFIGFLNTDDQYVANVFAAVRQGFDDNPRCQAICGGAEVYEEVANGGEREVVVYNQDQDKELSLRNSLLGVPIINARFFRRSVFDTVGAFDLRYPCASDRDFLLRASLAGICSAAIPAMVYRYRQHDQSLTIRSGKESRSDLYEEHMALAEQYLTGKMPNGLSRRGVQVFHTKNSVAALADFFSRGRPGSGFRALIRGLTANPAWLFDVCQLVLSKLLKRPYVSLISVPTAEPEP